MPYSCVIEDGTKHSLKGRDADKVYGDNGMATRLMHKNKHEAIDRCTACRNAAYGTRSTQPLNAELKYSTIL